MTDDFDLESLVHLEQTFYDNGHKEGFARGTILGRREGEVLGIQTGYELWDELGFYIGFTSTWEAILAQQGGNTDERLSHHIAQLKRTISLFPFTNPASDADIDVPQLLGQVRSRYKALCARLGVKSQVMAEQSSHGTTQHVKVWELENDPKAASAHDLSF